MFWSRSLLPQEWALLDRYFGAPVHRDWRRMRIYVRRLGDTRRALSFNGGFLSFPRHCFVASDPRQGLRLDQALIVGCLVHEAFHHWQRLQGRRVTREAVHLQWRYWRHGDNPYGYASCQHPAQLLQQFQQANVEQQAQMWQDAVMADRAWRAAPPEHPRYMELECAAQPWQAVLRWVQLQGQTPSPSRKRATHHV